MVNYFKNAFKIILLFIICLIVYIGCTFKTNQSSSIRHDDLIEYNTYEVYDISGNFIGLSTDSNISVEPNALVYFKLHIPSNIAYSTSFGIYTCHTNLHIFNNNTLLYSFTVSQDNAFGHTSSYGYHIIDNIYTYKDSTLTFWLDSGYGLNNSRFPTVYIGSSIDIINEMVFDKLSVVLIAIITMIVGVIIGLYWIFSRNKQGYGHVMGYLSLFSLVLSIWCLNETPIVTYLLHNPIVSGYISFISLMLLPIPFALFLRELYVDKEHPFWAFVIGMNVISIFSQVLLQLLNIYDFEQMLKITHIVFALTIGSIVLFTIRDCIKYGIGKKMYLNIMCMIICTIGVIIDMVIYYSGGLGTIVYTGLFSFLIYVVIIGFSTINDTSSLAEKGEKSEIYKEMAYTDGLTKLLNRTAMNSSFNKSNDLLDKNTYIILMCDLNNLKKCNDTYGHEEGDNYILEASKIISSAFEDIGKTYRIGGDEFCIILKNIDENTCKDHLIHMNQMINDYNVSKTSPFSLQIAYGYATYDKTMDKNLTETRARADALMYEMKFKMKQAPEM